MLPCAIDGSAIFARCGGGKRSVGCRRGEDQYAMRKSHWRRLFYYFSLCHVVYAFCGFALITTLFVIFLDDVMGFWKRYKSDSTDARWAFNPTVFIGGWATVFTFALWDYCALGSVLTIKEDHTHRQSTRSRAQQLCWIRHGVGNERLAESCHGFCDNRFIRPILLAVRIAVSSAMLTIAGMTSATYWSGSSESQSRFRTSFDERSSLLAEVVLAATLMDLPLTLLGSTLHSVYTYYWVRNFHRIEIMAIPLTADEPSTEFTDNEDME